jgi:transposase
MAVSEGNYAGIDVCQERLDLAVWPGGAAASFSYDAAGIRALLERLRREGVVLVVLEATGGIEVRAAAELQEAGIAAVVINPRQARDFARSLGKLAKNDRIDALVLARFGEAVKPEPRALPDAQHRLLGDLVARRRQLVEMRTAELNRQTRATAKAVQRSHRGMLKAIERELEDVDGQVRDLIKSSPVWRAQEELYRSVPGVGEGTAHLLVAEMPELGSLSRTQVAALAGLAPYDRDSGKHRGRRSIGGGRGTVRAMLYMATLTATRCNPVIRTTFQRLRERGKSYKVAMVACMRKLLVILNTIATRGTPWKNEAQTT